MKAKPPPAPTGTEGFQFQKGWPADTDEQQAIADTIPIAVAHQESEGWVVLDDPPLHTYIIRTPAHIEAGEFLAGVDGVRKRPEG